MNKFKKYYKIGQDIVSILENELHTVITDDERVYLLLHIARLDTMNSYHNEI